MGGNECRKLTVAPLCVQTMFVFFFLFRKCWKATLFCSKCQHVGHSTRFSMQAGLPPTGRCSIGSSNPPLLLLKQHIRFWNAADSSPWKPALSFEQSNTVPNSWLEFSSSPWRSFHWRVCLVFSRLAHPTLFSLSSAHIPVCLSAVIPALNLHNLIPLKSANDQNMAFCLNVFF